MKIISFNGPRIYFQLKGSWVGVCLVPGLRPDCGRTMVGIDGVQTRHAFTKRIMYIVVLDKYYVRYATKNAYK